MVFGDTHAPFHHKRCLEFLADISSDFKPDTVVHTGDLTDQYNFSRFERDMVADKPGKELKKMRDFTSKLHDIFPDLTIVKSNHDVRLWQAAKKGGIPRECLISWDKLIGSEDFDWKLVNDYLFTVDSDRSKWQVSHHKTGTALSTSQKLGRNVVLGHHHTRQGTYRWSPEKGKTLWGVDTGCLIDNKTYAFYYAKANALQQVGGAVLIEDGIPRIVPLR
jgi:predicted phosphodiesterase